PAALPHLDRLAWRDAAFGTAGVRALVRSPLLGRLLARHPVLDLRGRRLSAAAAAALARAPALAAATALHLDDNRLGDEGAAALARAPHFRHLTALTLSGN